MAVFLALLLVVAAAAGCVGGINQATGNGDSPEADTTPDSEQEGDQTTETSATSLDVTVKGYEGGQMQGSLRIRARELDKENPDLRAEEKSGQIVIYNNDEGVGYVYEPDNEQWIQVSGTMADQFVDPFITAAEGIQEMVDDYGVGDTANLAYGGESAEWTKNADNPSFSESIFQPPAGADVQETALPG